MHCAMLKIQGGVAIVEKLNYLLLTRERLQYLFILRPFIVRRAVWSLWFLVIFFKEYIRCAPRKKYN